MVHQVLDDGRILPIDIDAVQDDLIELAEILSQLRLFGEHILPALQHAGLVTI